MKQIQLLRLSSLLLFLSISFFSISYCNGRNELRSAPIPVVQNDTLRTFTNPLGNITKIGDPYILKANNMYYMYATSSGKGFKVWESPNLIDWTEKGLALDKNNPSNQWGSKSFWAPEVKFYHNKYYMTYSATSPNGKNKIRIARSDTPLGPFINWSDPFYQSDDFSYIDGDLLLDGDKVYLFYDKAASTNLVNGKKISNVYVVQLDAELKEMVGTAKKILEPDQAWEGLTRNMQWNEGAYVIKHDNTYYLLYSSNAYTSPNYAVGYATASSPMGTWTKSTDNPILKKDLAARVSGPGHCCITTSPDGKEFFIVYHTHTNFDSPGGNRNLCIDRLIFEQNKIIVKGPTRTPQPLPSGIPFRIIQ